jgi:hypothetical protein
VQASPSAVCLPEGRGLKPPSPVSAPISAHTVGSTEGKKVCRSPSPPKSETSTGIVAYPAPALLREEGKHPLRSPVAQPCAAPPPQPPSLQPRPSCRAAHGADPPPSASPCISPSRLPIPPLPAPPPLAPYRYYLGKSEVSFVPKVTSSYLCKPNSESWKFDWKIEVCFHR